MSDGIHDGWDFGGAAEVPGILVIKGTIVWRCLIEDHRPLLVRLRELLVNGGGHGQGNGTAGRKFYPCWACGGHPLKCGGGSMCASKQGLA